MKLEINKKIIIEEAFNNEQKEARNSLIAGGLGITGAYGGGKLAFDSLFNIKDAQDKAKDESIQKSLEKYINNHQNEVNDKFHTKTQNYTGQQFNDDSPYMKEGIPKLAEKEGFDNYLKAVRSNNITQGDMLFNTDKLKQAEQDLPTTEDIVQQHVDKIQGNLNNRLTNIQNDSITLPKPDFNDKEFVPADAEIGDVLLPTLGTALGGAALGWGAGRYLGKKLG
jgi:hypothetical protein